MADPQSKLDMSTFQPLQNSNATLDMKTFEPLPGQPTTPANSLTGQWNTQNQQWEYAEPNTVRTQGATERFARSFNKGVTGAEDPQGFVNNLKQMASQTASDIADEINNRPAQAVAGPALGMAGLPGSQRVLESIYAGMKQTWDRAAQELKNGNITSKEGLLNYVNGVIHATESGIPIAGPMLSDADKELGAGNVAGAAGTVTSLAAPALMGSAGGNLEADTGSVTNPAQTTAAPSTARAVAGKVARTVSGAVDPDITGVISPRLAHVQRVLGRAADALQKQPAPTVTPEVPTTVQFPEGSWSGQVRGSAPVEGEPTAQVQTATRTQATTRAEVPTAPSASSAAVTKFQADTAKAVGADSWDSVNPRIQQQAMAQATAPGGELHGIVAPASNKPVIDAESAEKPALSSGTTAPNLSTEQPKPSTPDDVVDAAIPPSANKALNMKTKAEVDFYVQKGDVEGAKAAIQNAANKLSPKPGTFADAQEDAGIQQFMRQDLQGQYGKGRLVEGREQAAANSADRTKLAGIPKQGEQFATRLTRYPAPEGDMEANKMLGYDQHATPQPVQTPSERPNEQPWGGLSEQDLTAVLQKSVDLAKNARKLQTK